jgi:hypothetical protein
VKHFQPEKHLDSISSPTTNRQWRSWPYLALLVASIVACFTFRLIPSPTSDRAIFVSVAEYLNKGSRLYVDVYDNKDPLFYYAVSSQRLFGVTGEYVFELSMALIAALSACDIARSLGSVGKLHQKALLIAVPFLVTGAFWVPGDTHLPATAMALLCCSLYFRKRFLLSGSLMAILLFTKLIMFPLPVVFCLASELSSSRERRLRTAAQNLGLILIGFIFSAVSILAILASRGELFGYLQAQQNNILYANSVLIDSYGFAGPLGSHLRTVFTDQAGVVSVVVVPFAGLILAICVAIDRGEPQARSFAIATLATFLFSLFILAIMGLWRHHLQIMYFGQTLILIALAAMLSSHLKRRSRPITMISVISLAVLLGGMPSFRHYIDSPAAVVKKLASASQDSAESQSFRLASTNGDAFARLGQNSNVIPHGSPMDKLACPDFHQYLFYSSERLQNILDCVRMAPTLVIDPSFRRYEQPPNWLPIEADKQRIIDTWNHFVSAGETMVRTRFSCKRFDQIRICSSTAL